MKSSRNLIISALLLTVLSACSNASLKSLRSVEPQGDAFSQALSQHYLLLSEEEHDYGRYSNSQFMAEKGLASAYGKSVYGEVPRDGVRYSGHREQLLKGRNVLDALLTDAARANHPKDAAKTQVLYDCWLSRVHAKARRNEIEMCQQSFYNRATLLRHNMGNPDISSGATPSLSTSYLIYFEWNKAALNAQALANLRTVAQQILSIKEPFELVLNGHTDTSGTEDYNRTLSQRRAESIRTLLARFGVPKSIMSVFAFGESDPVVPTGNGVRETKNRRVEIFLE